MLALLSNEGKIRRILGILRCADVNFSKINGGIVSNSRLAQALSEDDEKRKPLDQRDAELILEVLAEMIELQDDIKTKLGVDVDIDWSRTEKIKNALVTRRIRKIEKELNLPPNEHLQTAAQLATDMVSQ
jgi:hypothetical protein